MSLSTWARVGEKFSIMSYNVENLFDHIHDDGKNDWEFLPLAFKKKSSEAQQYCKTIGIAYYKKNCKERDWNKKVLAAKIANISRVLKSFNRGRTADIIVLQEVENMRVLKMLRDKGLQDQGLKTLVLLEGGDRRGIDVAIMSRFPLVEEPRLHITKIKIIKSNGVKMTKSSGRGILEATFNIYGEEVVVLSNHWPSQRSPDSYRDQIARTMQEVSSKNSHRIIISAGDFNTLPSDRPHGVNNWVLSDDYNQPFKDPLHHINHELSKGGTYWYRGRWSFLDRIFIWSNPIHALVPLWGTLEVLARPWMLKDFKYYNKKTKKSKVYRGIPKRFDSRHKSGFSDHLPMAMSFIFER